VLDLTLSEILLLPFSSVAEFIQVGGWVVWWIMATALLMWTLIAERAFWFWRVLPVERNARQQRWQARSERHSWCARRIRMAMIGELSVAMSAPLPLLKALIPICPLLGLLGTVSGMLEVFDVMAIKGQSDPKSMADGISHAMIATLSGLAVALSGLYFSYYFQARATRETERLNSVLALEDDA
jgi:biopolymer transport protein ExbB